MYGTCHKKIKLSFNFPPSLQVVIMETNPFMKTSISDLVHMRNEAYKKLSLQVTEITRDQRIEFPHLIRI